MTSAAALAATPLKFPVRWRTSTTPPPAPTGTPTRCDCCAPSRSPGWRPVAPAGPPQLPTPVPAAAGAVAAAAAADAPVRILHVATRKDWADAEAVGRYEVSSRGQTLAAEGFIHT